MPLLSPLAGVSGVTFVSLQMGSTASQIAQAPMRIVDLTVGIQDFADTAALIENLDMVISICTSVAHLAGAMGKRVWTMIPYRADWRWLKDREDTPWYPTMRLFRQPRLGEWKSVVERVAGELQEVAGR